MCSAVLYSWGRSGITTVDRCWLRMIELHKNFFTKSLDLSFSKIGPHYVQVATANLYHWKIWCGHNGHTVSLVGALLLLLECYFSVCKVYYKEVSMVSYWKFSLSSRSFAFAFHDAIRYPSLFGGKMRNVYSKIIQMAWNVFLDPRINKFQHFSPLNTFIS